MANKAMDDEASSTRTFADLDANNEVVSALGEFNTILPSSIRAPETSGVAPTTIVLVRHGRTALTEQNRISGRGGADPELSDSGVKDAEAVSKELAKFGRPGSFSHLEPISAVIASPIRRTVETARVIASQVGIHEKTDERFAEISFGDWDGLTHDQAQQLDSELFESWRGSWTVAPPNGENLADFDARVLDGLGDVIEQNPGKTIAIVAHVMPIRGVIRAAINGANDVYWRVQVAPCSITILRFWGLDSAEVITINSTSHLNQG
jgi:probable phosphoglycerate mutase